MAPPGFGSEAYRRHGQRAAPAGQGQREFAAAIADLPHAVRAKLACAPDRWQVGSGRPAAVTTSVHGSCRGAGSRNQWTPSSSI